MIDESNNYPLLNNLINSNHDSVFYWMDPESETEILAKDLFQDQSSNDSIKIRINKFSTYSNDTLWKDFNSKNIYSTLNFEKRKVNLPEFDDFIKKIDLQIDAKVIDLSLDPNYSDWEENIKACYQKFNNENFKKIVMSRKSVFKMNDELNSKAVLINLMKTSFNSTFFYLKINDSIFLGASPEKLFFRKENVIQSDSLAGTRPRGKNKEQDLLIENELLNNEKELREQAIVSEEIIKIFKNLCSQIDDSDKVKVKKLSNLQHIHKTIYGNLEENVSDDDIIEALHPTPAVGGVPRDKALKAISEIENNDRGLYASPIGWQLGVESQYIVGIRSLLYRSDLKEAFVFTGAGIVEGSESLKEWNEINNKMKTYLTILQYDFKK